MQVYQVAADGRNLFNIVENRQLLFRATAPFYKPTLPIGGDVFRRLTLSDANNNLLLHTDYDADENFAASALPLSWIYKDSKKVRRYSVLNNANQLIAYFYFEQKGVQDIRLVIEWGNKLISCFMKSAGKIEVVSFYDGDIQIGQMTKPNCVLNNLDCYVLHFLEGTLSRELIAMFTVYYDFLYHNNSGNISVGWRAGVSYTYDKNSKKYNKNFIADNFGKAESECLEQFIKNIYDSRKN